MMRKKLFLLLLMLVIENKRPTPNAQRPTFNSKAVSSRVAETTRELSSALSVTLSNLRAYCPLSEILHRLRGSGRQFYPTAAITLSSIAIGVGNAPTSIVVRVGF